MTALSPQLERALTRPWSTAAALAALFVALEGLMSGVNLFAFFARADDQIEDRWDLFGDEWLRYVLYLLIGLAAAHVLQLAVRSEVAHEWPPLVLRAVILYVPVSLVISFVVGLIYAVAHNLPFDFLGFEVLG